MTIICNKFNEKQNLNRNRQIFKSTESKEMDNLRINEKKKFDLIYLKEATLFPY